ALEAARAVRRLEDLHPFGLEVDAAEQPDRSLVVDHEDASHSVPVVVHAGHPLFATGSAKVNLEPLPSSERTQIRPPIADTRPWAMKRPRPVPGCASLAR